MALAMTVFCSNSRKQTSYVKLIFTEKWEFGVSSYIDMLSLYYRFEVSIFNFCFLFDSSFVNSANKELVYMINHSLIILLVWFLLDVVLLISRDSIVPFCLAGGEDWHLRAKSGVRNWYVKYSHYHIVIWILGIDFVKSFFFSIHMSNIKR